MSQSKFFDTHKPVESVQQGKNDASHLFGGAAAQGFQGYNGSRTKKRDEVDAYTLFNYLSVTRIAMKGSQQVPLVGTLLESGQATGGESQRVIHLSIQDKRELIRKYGGRILQNIDQEVAPLSDDHPLCTLLRSINPDDWWQSFLYELLLFLELTGEAFVWMVPSGMRTDNAPAGLPVQLWVIPTQWVELVYSKSGKLEAYRIIPYGDTRRQKDIPPEQILPIKFKNPLDKNRGYSPSRAGGPWIDANEAIEESRYHAFTNSITPSVWLKITDPNMVNPTDEILDRIKEKWMQRASGMARSREPQIVPPGIDIDHTGNLRPQEMDYPGSSSEVRDNILALRGINKFIAGYTEGMNRAQVETALVHFCEILINPVLGIIGGAFQEKLAPLFDPGIRIWFPDCTPYNRQQRLAELKFLFSAGGFTPNQGRQEFGFETLDDAAYDKGYMGKNLMPTGETPKEEKNNDSSENLPSKKKEEEEQQSKNGNGKPHRIDPMDLLLR